MTGWVTSSKAYRDWLRVGMISRYCVNCDDAQWNHRGVDPRKTWCRLRGCDCRHYVRLTQEWARELAAGKADADWLRL